MHGCCFRIVLGGEVYLGEFDHVNWVPAILPLFGFLISMYKTQYRQQSAMNLCVYMSILV